MSSAPQLSPGPCLHAGPQLETPEQLRKGRAGVTQGKRERGGRGANARISTLLNCPNTPPHPPQPYTQRCTDTGTSTGRTPGQQVLDGDEAHPSVPCGMNRPCGRETLSALPQAPSRALQGPPAHPRPLRQHSPGPLPGGVVGSVWEGGLQQKVIFSVSAHRPRAWGKGPSQCPA